MSESDEPLNNNEFVQYDDNVSENSYKSSNEDYINTQKGGAQNKNLEYKYIDEALTESLEILKQHNDLLEKDINDKSYLNRSGWGSKKAIQNKDDNLNHIKNFINTLTYNKSNFNGIYKYNINGYENGVIQRQNKLLKLNFNNDTDNEKKKNEFLKKLNEELLNDIINLTKSKLELQNIMLTKKGWFRSNQIKERRNLNRFLDEFFSNLDNYLDALKKSYQLAQSLITKINNSGDRNNLPLHLQSGAINLNKIKENVELFEKVIVDEFNGNSIQSQIPDKDKFTDLQNKFNETIKSVDDFVNQDLINNQKQGAQGRVNAKNPSNQKALMSSTNPSSSIPLETKQSLQEALNKLSEENKKKYQDNDDMSSFVNRDCEDLTCCPPSSSRLKTSYEFRSHRLKEEISFARKMLGFFCGVFLFLGTIFVYSLVQFFKMIKKWIEHRKDREVREQKIKETAGSRRDRFQNPRNDNFDDNYNIKTDKSEFAEKRDDFEQFNKTIDSSLKEYRDYNNRIKNFFIKNGIDQNDKVGKLPSVIDDRVLDKQYDNW